MSVRGLAQLDLARYQIGYTTFPPTPNTVWHRTDRASILRFMPERTLPEVAKDLELAAARLAGTLDFDLRRELLLQMRFLLMEAETFMIDPPARQS